MKSSDIIKRLIDEGWIKVGGKGDHDNRRALFFYALSRDIPFILEFTKM